MRSCWYAVLTGVGRGGREHYASRTSTQLLQSVLNIAFSRRGTMAATKKRCQRPDGRIGHEMGKPRGKHTTDNFTSSPLYKVFYVSSKVIFPVSAS